MNSDSDWIDTLVASLRKAGDRLGFSIETETPKLKGPKIDLIWYLAMPPEARETPLLIPERLAIVTFELQNSYSPASISHGIVKATSQHPCVHFVISRNKLSPEMRKMYEDVYSVRWLRILDEPAEIELLVLKLTRLQLRENLGQAGRDAVGRIREEIRSGDMEHARATVETELDTLLVPRLNELLELAAHPDIGSKAVDEVYQELFRVVHSAMSKAELETIELSIEDLIDFRAAEQSFKDFWNGREFGKVQVLASPRDLPEIVVLDYDGKPFTLLFKRRHLVVEHEDYRPAYHALTVEEVERAVPRIIESTRRQIEEHEVSPEAAARLRKYVERMRDILRNR